MKNLVIIFVFVLLFLGVQTLVRFVNEWLGSRIEGFVKACEGAGIPKEIEQDFKKEIETFKFLKLKKELNKLGLITVLIGLVEFCIFVPLTMVILQRYGLNIFEVVKNIGIVTSGWIALKIFGSYSQWSGAILGRSTFYIFLISSLLNIILAISIGIIFYNHTIFL